MQHRLSEDPRSSAEWVARTSGHASEEDALGSDIGPLTTLPKYNETLLLDPFNHYRLGWSIAMLVIVMTYVSFLVPFGIAWSLPIGQAHWFAITELVVGFMFLVDIFVNFRTSVIVVNKGRYKLVSDPVEISKIYIKRKFDGFYIDAIATIPFFIDFVAFCVGGVSGGTMVKTLRGIKALRILQLAKPMFSTSLGIQGLLEVSLSRKVSPVAFYLVEVFYYFIVLMNIFGCIWFWVAKEFGGSYDNNWLEDRGLVDAGTGRQYLAAVYWSTTTLTTVGYGDITPTNAAEEAAAMFVMFVGVIFFGYNAGSVTVVLDTFGESNKRRSDFRIKASALDRWLERRRLEPSTQKRLRAHFFAVWSQAESDLKSDKEMLETLPVSLRKAAAISLCGPAIRSILRTVDGETVDYICGAMVPRHFPVGEYIVHEGHPANAYFLVMEGDLEVSFRGNVIRVLTTGDFFGCFSSVMCSDPETCKHRDCVKNKVSVHALSGSDVFELPEKNIRAVLRDNPVVVEAFRSLYEGNRKMRTAVRRVVSNIRDEVGAEPATMADVQENWSKKVERSRKGEEPSLASFRDLVGRVSSTVPSELSPDKQLREERGNMREDLQKLMSSVEAMIAKVAALESTAPCD